MLSKIDMLNKKFNYKSSNNPQNLPVNTKCVNVENTDSSVTNHTCGELLNDFTLTHRPVEPNIEKMGKLKVAPNENLQN